MSADPARSSPGDLTLLRALLDLLPLPQALPEPAPEQTEHEYAQRLAAVGVTAFGADAAAVLIVDDAGAPGVFAGTDDGTRALAGIETSDGAGPALDCCRAAQAEVFEVAAAGDRWQHWTETAVRQGWDLAEAVPLKLRTRTVGGMVLLRRPGRARPDGLAAWPGALAAVAASVLIQQRALTDLARRADQLQIALTSRIVIEQAKGVLAERGGLDVQTAFDRLRRYARAHRHRLTDVAAEVVTGDVADAVLTHVRPGLGPPSILDL
jgi:hypothetical protein